MDQKESKGLFPVRVAASFTQWQEWKPFLFTHTRTLTYSSFYRSHTLCSRLQSSVSYWPSVSLPIQLSVHARVCVCAAVWGSDRSRWRWVYNHETAVVVFIIILLPFLLLTENNEHEARAQGLSRNTEIESPHFSEWRILKHCRAWLARWNNHLSILHILSGGNVKFFTTNGIISYIKQNWSKTWLLQFQGNAVDTCASRVLWITVDNLISFVVQTITTVSLSNKDI